MMTERDELIDLLKARARELGEERDRCMSRVSDLKVCEREFAKEQNEIQARINELMRERDWQRGENQSDMQTDRELPKPHGEGSSQSTPVTVSGKG
jgi:uncharacterized coiled-coil DUF342 family protein